MEDETLPKSKPRNRNAKRDVKVNSVDVQNQGDGRVVLRMVVPVGSGESSNSTSNGSLLKRAVQALVKAQTEGLLKRAQLKKQKKKTKKQNKYKNQRAGKKVISKKTTTTGTIVNLTTNSKDSKIKKKKKKEERRS